MVECYSWINNFCFEKDQHSLPFVELTQQDKPRLSACVDCIFIRPWHFARQTEKANDLPDSLPVTFTDMLPLSLI